MAMPPHLAKGLALKSLQQAGYTKAEAERVFAQKNGAKRGPGRPRKDSMGGEVVAFPGGDGVRPPGRGGALYAKIAAAPEVAFDQRALAAIWQGLIDALRTDGQMDPASLFPDLYCTDGGDPAMAQERAIGREMAQILGPALAALNVSAQEWGGFYGRVGMVRMQAPRQASCWGAAPSAPAAPAAAPSMGSGWGTITGAPLLAPGRQ